MPDRNGNQTPRDRFPIYCDVCAFIIKPTEYNTYGECTQPGEEYWTLGHRIEQGIPTNFYAHKECMSWRPTDKPKQKDRITGNYCVYCNEPCGDDYCCPECKDENERAMRIRQPGDEVLELIKQLKELTAIHAPVPSTTDRQPTESRGGTASATKPRSELVIDTNKIGPFVPSNEQGVIFMVGKILDKIGYRMAHIKQSFPDAVVIGRDNKPVRIEFEYTSSNFINHGHDPEGCDLVICWELDKSLPLPVIALARHYDSARGTWDFSDIARFAT